LGILEESLLACDAFFADSRTHSKAPLCWNGEDVYSPTLFQKPVGFSSFFREILPFGVLITLGSGLELRLCKLANLSWSTSQPAAADPAVAQPTKVFVSHLIRDPELFGDLHSRHISISSLLNVITSRAKRVE
jgi:hypothetical protein